MYVVNKFISTIINCIHVILVKGFFSLDSQFIISSLHSFIEVVNVFPKSVTSMYWPTELPKFNEKEKKKEKKKLTN